MKEQIQPPKGAPLFNPWFPEFIADPYPFYHLLREAEPMSVCPLASWLQKLSLASSELAKNMPASTCWARFGGRRNVAAASRAVISCWLMPAMTICAPSPSGLLVSRCSRLWPRCWAGIAPTG